jgi:DNA invertase Pin-like site-specific DNA recombinase
LFSYTSFGREMGLIRWGARWCPETIVCITLFYMTTQRIGYSRVSTTDQNPESQQDALAKVNCDVVKVDHFTGTKSSRPEWDMVKGMLRKGDTLVITRLDRLGRSSKDLHDIAAFLQEKGVNLEATEQPIDTSTHEGKMFFAILAAFAEFEHGMMQARTIDGLAAARARGRVGGRKAKLTPQKIADIRAKVDGGEPITDVAEYYGVSRPTIYRALAE